jgi:hypothetical protein
MAGDWTPTRRIHMPRTSPHFSHTGQASNAEKQPTGPGPEGCDENGPAAALLVGHVWIQICSLLAPCRRPILIATKYLVFRGQDTSALWISKPKGQEAESSGNKSHENGDLASHLITALLRPKRSQNSGHETLQIPLILAASRFEQLMRSE